MHTVEGLILAGGLALFTFYQTGQWASPVQLWSRAAQFGTVRGHVNARQSYLDQGQVFDAIHECVWLVGHKHTAAAWQARDIERICSIAP